MNFPISIFLFRRDLRLHDNHALYMALKSGVPVLPIFIFNKEEIDLIHESDIKIELSLKQLNKIKKELENYGSSLEIFIEEPLSCIKNLLSKYSVKSVYLNNEYDPKSVSFEKQLKELLNKNGSSLYQYKDHVIFEKKELTTPQGTPFTSFSSYSRKWREDFNLKNYPSEKYTSRFVKVDPFQDFSLDILNLKPIGLSLPEYDLSNNTLVRYDRNKDYPGLVASSTKIGPHLSYGIVSIREITATALKYNNHFLEELILRDFYAQALFNFPKMVSEPFKENCDKLEWKNDMSAFQKWMNGNTGFPFVDAAMRELNSTGTIHFQARLAAASFLCKNLHISWQWGERYFAKKLLDYDMASNIGNWQSVAGTGIDAMPYFKIINPKNHMEKFDPSMTYVKKWVPEMKSPAYQPIVDFIQTRDECFNMYKKALILKK